MIAVVRNASQAQGQPQGPEDISLTEVTKTFTTGLFKTKVGVDSLTLGVPRGKVIGLLGPNGSGKSTTIKMVIGFLKPTSGEILVCGLPASERASRRHIGYLPENPRFQKFLTASEVLRYYGGLLDLGGNDLGKRVDEVLEMVNLKHAARERVQGFSKGMTQRLAIAQSLLHRPRILIFDEPMSGLDPLGRMEIRRLISQVHDQMPEATIFFSTHILADVEELCSYVAVLRKGKLATFCPIDHLMTGEGERFEVMVKGELPPSMRERFTREHCKLTPLGVSVTIEGTDTLIDRLGELRRNGAVILGISSQRRSLEEALFKEGQLPPTVGADLPRAAGASL